jgi:hypothetical protein
MAFYDAFFGSDQSLYTAYAIMAAIIAICIMILLTATDISVGNRILIVLFVIITLIPSIFLTLFEITCMVTGGTEPNRWWCYAFAWVLAAFIIIYCVFVVIISLISLFTYNNAIDNINEVEQKNKLSDTDSNHIAKQIIDTDEEIKKLESFYDMQNVKDETNGVQPFEPLSHSSDVVVPQQQQNPIVNNEKEEKGFSASYEGFQDAPASSNIKLHFSNFGDNSITGAGSAMMSSLYDLRSFANDTIKNIM